MAALTRRDIALRVIFVFHAIIDFIFGIPSLLFVESFNEAVLNWPPLNTGIANLLGASFIGWGIGHLIAFRSPEKNLGIIQMSAIWTLLASITSFYHAAFGNAPSLLWATGIIGIFFVVSYMVLYPSLILPKA